MTTNNIADTLSSSLGLSYGINVSELVTTLVSASKDPKKAALDAKVTTNNARISALASTKGSLSTFSSALSQLLKSSDYNGQPASSDPTIASISALPGGSATGLPAQIEVKKLATAQVLRSAALGSASDRAGSGTLTLTTAKGNFDLVIKSPSNSLNDVAKAINGSNAGVSATVVTDSSGARLVLKGETGEGKGFSLSTADGDDDLKRFTFAVDGDGNTTGNLSRTQTAQSAEIAVDGVEMKFDSNTVTTAIPYLRIDLNRAQAGTKVTLAMSEPAASMSDLVNEFVGAYNTLKTTLNTATTASATGSVISDKTTEKTAGLLATDTGMRDMVNQLSKLTSMQLSATGPYKTLADIGVTTNRDGSLMVDTSRLTKVLSENPDAVTQMLNPANASPTSPGLGGAMKSITDYLNSSTGPLATSESTYASFKDTLQEQLDKLDTTMTDYEARLTSTYTAMQGQLTALKAQQSYLEQQIDSWNKN